MEAALPAAFERSERDAESRCNKYPRAAFGTKRLSARIRACGGLPLATIPLLRARTGNSEAMFLANSASLESTE